MATFQDIQEYYEALNESFKSGEVSDRYNTDRSHNATVFRFMLDKSNRISMFCGELSLLRNNFYSHVLRDCGDEDGIQIMEAMYNSLERFFEKEGVLTVILENKEASSEWKKKDLVYQALNSNKLKLYYLDDKLTSKRDLNHFALTDVKIVRTEQDKIAHTAVCTLNDDSYFETSKVFFDRLKSYSVPMEMI